MVIKTKSATPIKPLVPIGLGFGSRILDRYGWGGYYSWNALFMLFKNNPALSSAEGEYKFPISLFLKFINQPGKSVVSRPAPAILKHRPGLPSVNVLQPIYMNNNQPGGSMLSPGLVSLAGAEPSNKIPGSNPGQPAAIRYGIQADNKLPGRAAEPVYLGFTDITNLLLRWSQYSNIYHQLAAGLREKATGSYYSVPGFRPAITTQSTGRQQSGPGVTNLLPPVSGMTRSYPDPLPVIPFNAFYTTYTNYADITHRIYGAGYKTAAVTQKQGININLRENSLRSDPGQVVQVPYGGLEQRLINIIRRENPEAAAGLLKATGNMPYSTFLPVGDQTAVTQLTGYSYQNNTVLQYLLRYNNQHRYIRDNDYLSHRHYLSASNADLDHYINLGPSPAIFTGGDRPAQVAKGTVSQGWVIPGERPAIGEKRSRGQTGVVHSAVSPLQVFNASGLINPVQSLPLLVPGGYGFIPYVPGRSRGAGSYYREGGDLRLVHVQSEPKPAGNHPIFNAGTAALNHEARLIISRLASQPAAVVKYFEANAPRTHSAGGSYITQNNPSRLIEPVLNKLPRWGGTTTQLVPAVGRSGGQTVQGLPRLWRNYHLLNREAGLQTMEYHMINRQMPAMALVYQMARLGRDLQTLNRSGEYTITQTGIPPTGSQEYINREYVYDRYLAQIYRYVREGRGSNRELVQSVSNISRDLSGAERSTTLTDSRINMTDRWPGPEIYGPGNRISGSGRYQPSQKSVISNYYQISRLPGFATQFPIRQLLAVDGYSDLSNLPATAFKGDHYPNLSLASGKLYQSPAQQGLKAAVRMLDWIITKVSGGESGPVARYISRGERHSALPERSGASADRLPHLIDADLPTRHFRKSSGSGQPGVIQRYLSEKTIDHWSAGRYHLTADRGQYRDRPGLASSESSMYNRNLLTGIVPQPGRKTLIGSVLDYQIPRSFPINTDKELRQITRSVPLPADRQPGRVLRKLADHKTGTVKADMREEAGYTERYYETPLLSRAIKKEVHYQPGRLSVWRSTESLRQTRENSRSIYSDPIRYVGKMIREMTGSTAVSAPAALDYRIPDHTQVEGSVPSSALASAAGTTQQRLRADSHDLALSAGMVHKTSLGSQDKSTRAVAARISVGNAGWPIAAGLSRRESGWTGLQPDLTVAAVTAPAINSLEPKSMILYQDRWHTTNRRDNASFPPAFASGVELNYRQEVQAAGKAQETGAPVVTPEMIQAQIEASKSEGPPEITSAEIRVIADRVYSEIQRRMKIDRQCRGI